MYDGQAAVGRGIIAGACSDPPPFDAPTRRTSIFRNAVRLPIASRHSSAVLRAWGLPPAPTASANPGMHTVALHVPKIHDGVMIGRAAWHETLRVP